jgi:hypothetical protein
MRGRFAQFVGCAGGEKLAAKECGVDRGEFLSCRPQGRMAPAASLWLAGRAGEGEKPCGPSCVQKSGKIRSSGASWGDDVDVERCGVADPGLRTR